MKAKYATPTHYMRELKSKLVQQTMQLENNT